MKAPNNWLHICQEELQRGKLTSIPLKVRFMEERGFKDLDEVHDWMISTRKAFEAMVVNTATQVKNNKRTNDVQEWAARTAKALAENINKTANK